MRGVLSEGPASKSATFNFEPSATIIIIKKEY